MSKIPEPTTTIEIHETDTLVPAIMRGRDGNTTVQANIACRPAGSKDLYCDTRGPKGELIVGNLRFKAD